MHVAVPVALAALFLFSGTVGADTGQIALGPEFILSDLGDGFEIENRLQAVVDKPVRVSLQSGAVVHGIAITIRNERIVLELDRDRQVVHFADVHSVQVALLPPPDPVVSSTTVNFAHVQTNEQAKALLENFAATKVRVQMRNYASEEGRVKQVLGSMLVLAVGDLPRSIPFGQILSVESLEGPVFGEAAERYDIRKAIEHAERAGRLKGLRSTPATQRSGVIVRPKMPPLIEVDSVVPGPAPQLDPEFAAAMEASSGEDRGDTQADFRRKQGGPLGETIEITRRHTDGWQALAKRLPRSESCKSLARWFCAAEAYLAKAFGVGTTRSNCEERVASGLGNGRGDARACQQAFRQLDDTVLALNSKLTAIGDEPILTKPTRSNARKSLAWAIAAIEAGYRGPLRTCWSELQATCHLIRAELAQMDVSGQWTKDRVRADQANYACAQADQGIAEIARAIDLSGPPSLRRRLEVEMAMEKGCEGQLDLVIGFRTMRLD